MVAGPTATSSHAAPVPERALHHETGSHAAPVPKQTLHHGTAASVPERALHHKIGAPVPERAQVKLAQSLTHESSDTPLSLGELLTSSKSQVTNNSGRESEMRVLEVGGLSSRVQGNVGAVSNKTMPVVTAKPGPPFGGNVKPPHTDPPHRGTATPHTRSLHGGTPHTDPPHGETAHGGTVKPPHTDPPHGGTVKPSRGVDSCEVEEGLVISALLNAAHDGEDLTELGASAAHFSHFHSGSDQHLE